MEELPLPQHDKKYSNSIVRRICLPNPFVIDCVPSLDPEERAFVTSKSTIHLNTYPTFNATTNKTIINEMRAEICNNNHVKIRILKSIWKFRFSRIERKIRYITLECAYNPTPPLLGSEESKGNLDT